MSVVNKMLQDIDRRRVGAGADSVAGGPPPARIPPRRRRGNRSRWLWLAGIAVLLVVVILYHWEAMIKPSPPPVVAAAPVAALPLPPNPMAAPEQGLPSTVPPPQEAVAPIKDKAYRAASADTLRMSKRLSALMLAPPPALPSAAASAPAAAASPLPVARGTSSPSPPASSSAPAGADTNPPSIAIRHIAGEETVRAARGLWNDGAHAAAAETLRQALAAAESQHDSAPVQPLARELARFQVADNNPQAALVVLQQYESRFIDDAEAWALRGNAQQRLGQHAEAADSYRAALRLKAGEPRWMLGAAVSLAAIGKLDEARSWADRAAERGPIPPSIATYLKQLGVALP